MRKLLYSLVSLFLVFTLTGCGSDSLESLNADFVGKPWQSDSGYHTIVIDEDTGEPLRDNNGNYITTKTPDAFTTNYSTAIIESIDAEGIIKVLDFETGEKYYLDGAYGNVLSAEDDEEYENFKLTNEMLENRKKFGVNDSTRHQ